MATSAKAAPAMHTTSKPSIAALAPVPAVAVDTDRQTTTIITMVAAVIMAVVLPQSELPL